MKNDIKDIKTLDMKIRKMKRKKRIYLFAGIIILMIGVATLALGYKYQNNSYTFVGIPFLVLGGILRFFYYLTISDIRSYEKLKTKISPVATIAFFMLSIATYAIQPGDRATELDNLKWLKGAPVTIFNETQQNKITDKNLTIIEYWSVKDNDSLLTLPILYDIKKSYSNKLKIISISTDSKEDIKTFLKTQEGKLVNYKIAIDPTKATLKCLAGRDFRIPQTFVINSIGQLLWRGHPIELKNVLKNIFQGSFDLNKQKKLSRFHNALQSFIQLEDVSQIKRTVASILKIAPDDDLALRVMLYDYRTRNKSKKALQFINKHINQYPEIPALYPLRFEIMNQNDFSIKKLAEELDNIMNKFPNNHQVIFQAAEIAVNRFPFATLPVKQTLKAAQTALNLLKLSDDNDPRTTATYLAVLAKAFYFAGKIENAVSTQEKVVKHLIFPKQKKIASDILNYYKIAMEAFNSENF